MASQILLILLVSCLGLEITGITAESEKAAFIEPIEQYNNDLNTDASAYYSNRYSEWQSNNYPYKYRNSVTGYGLLDDKNYNLHGPIRYYDNYHGYDNGNFKSSNDYKGFSNTQYIRGNGGYGGHGGNGGLNSYYGYNRPDYNGAHHLGYGYYDKRPRYSGIYSNGITPSLVTGYRGYSKK